MAQHRVDNHVDVLANYHYQNQGVSKITDVNILFLVLQIEIFASSVSVLWKGDTLHCVCTAKNN